MTNFVVKILLFTSISLIWTEKIQNPEFATWLRYPAYLAMWLLPAQRAGWRSDIWNTKYDSEIGGPFPPIIHPQKQWKRRVKKQCPPDQKLDLSACKILQSIASGAYTVTGTQFEGVTETWCQVFPTADDVPMHIWRGGGKKAINECRFGCRSVCRVFEAWTLVRYGLVRGSRYKTGEDIHIIRRLGYWLVRITTTICRRESGWGCFRFWGEHWGVGIPNWSYYY